MQTNTVSRDAIGLPAFISTPAKRRPEAVASPTLAAQTCSFQKLGTEVPEELDDEVSLSPHSPIPVVFLADPQEPTRAVGVFPYILPDYSLGTMGYTPEGFVVVPDSWLASAVPARPSAAKTLAATLRQAAQCRLTTSVSISAESHAAGENRRKRRFGPTSGSYLRPFLDIGRASALTSAAPDPKAGAMFLAHTLYRVHIGFLANAFGVTWTDAYNTIEAAKVRRQSGDAFAHHMEMAEDIARQDLESLGRLQGDNTPPELRAA